MGLHFLPYWETGTEGLIALTRVMGFLRLFQNFMKKITSFFTEIPKKTINRLWLILIWLILVYLFIINYFHFRNNFQVLLIVFLSLILWYVMKVVVWDGGHSDHLKYTILCRAIAVTQDKTNFIKGVERWEKKENFCPTDKGIDPDDVLRALNEANNIGKNDLKEEVRKYGFISQL